MPDSALSAAPCLCPLEAVAGHLSPGAVLGLFMRPVQPPAGPATGAACLDGADLARVSLPLARTRLLVLDRPGARVPAGAEGLARLRRLAGRSDGLVVVSGRPGLLLQVADRVAVAGAGGGLGFLDPGALRRSAVLQLALPPGACRHLAARWPEARAAGGVVQVPLFDQAAEAVLADCLALGLAVRASRVLFPALEGPPPVECARGGGVGFCLDRAPLSEEPPCPTCRPSATSSSPSPPSSRWRRPS